MQVPFSPFQRLVQQPDRLLERFRETLIAGERHLDTAVASFETDFAATVGRTYALAVATTADSLQLALKALGVTYGHEVITCANTFVDTAAAIHMAGARTVLVDCTETMVIDPDQIEAVLSAKTAAIAVVHHPGQPADLTALHGLADRYDLPLLENASGCIGARSGEWRVGSAGLLTTYSLRQPYAPCVWGDGGVITTDSEGLYQKLKLIRNHGMLDHETYAFFSFNSSLDPLQAIVARQQLARVAEDTERRAAIARRYDTAFSELAPHITVPPRLASQHSTFQQYMIQVQEREALMPALTGAGIEVRVQFPRPLHLQPAAAPLGYQPGTFPRTEQLAREIISLPCHALLTDAEVTWVIEQIQRFYQA